MSITPTTLPPGFDHHKVELFHDSETNDVHVMDSAGNLKKLNFGGNWRIHLTWDPPGDGDPVDYYIVNRSELPNETPDTWDFVSDGTEYDDMYTTRGRIYFYNVVAHNSAGDSSPTQTIAVCQL